MIVAETNNSVVTAGTWYNVILEVNGTSTYPKIYLNGTDITTYHPANFSGTLSTFSSDLYFGNEDAGVNAATEGYIDAVFIWNRVLTSGEKTTLQTYTYPFN